MVCQFGPELSLDGVGYSALATLITGAGAGLGMVGVGGGLPDLTLPCPYAWCVLGRRVLCITFAVVRDARPHVAVPTLSRQAPGYSRS